VQDHLMMAERGAKLVPLKFRRRKRQEEAPTWMALPTGFHYVPRQDLEQFEFDAETAERLDNTLQEIDRYHRTAEAIIGDLPLA
jgi:hypothetical protein